MMLGEPHRPNPTVHVPPWSLTLDDPTAEMLSPFALSDSGPYFLNEALTALGPYMGEADVESEGSEASEAPVDAYSCDQFRMFEFKVRRCARGRSHDWTECPYAHPGEKARRRDPRKYHYSGTACPDFRKGHCKKGDSCEFAHGVFECWLHPARYRTQPCKDGTSCRRRVCFFAHTPDQLRLIPPQQHSPRGSSSLSAAESYDGSPMRQAVKRLSVSPPESPPAVESPPVSEVVAALRNLQLGKVKSLPSCWKGGGSPGFGSPRGASMLRPGFCSLPTTPTRAPPRPVYMDFCDLEEEPAMERVESGRDIRARMLQKLRTENSVDRADPNPGSVGGPDVGWVSELVM